MTVIAWFVIVVLVALAVAMILAMSFVSPKWVERVERATLIACVIGVLLLFIYCVVGVLALILRLSS